MLIIVFDPGESTGWVSVEVDPDSKLPRQLRGGTVPRALDGFDFLVEKAKAYIGKVVIVYETFQLFPGRAKSLAWETFYPIEVIGVLKYIFKDFEIVGQQPSVKKYSGGIDETWSSYKDRGITEHTKDAYLHLKYYIRNGIKKCIQQ